MSATQVPIRPLKAGSMLKLWLGIALLIAAAAALAWIGAGSLRGETTATGVDLFYFAAEGGGHNEKSWAARVDKPLAWFFPWGSTRY